MPSAAEIPELRRGTYVFRSGSWGMHVHDENGIFWVVGQDYWDASQGVSTESLKKFSAAAIKAVEIAAVSPKEDDRSKDDYLVFPDSSVFPYDCGPSRAYNSALSYGPAKHMVGVLGLARSLETWQNIHGLETRVIPDTVACEDLHYHAESGMLYTACNGNITTAAGWMPGAQSFAHPETVSHGTLVVIDPKTMKSQKLTLENFDGPFSTHGISLYTPPSDPQTVYVYAVNHVPNPRWTPASSGTETRSSPRVELFAHRVGGATARHVRTVGPHPRIRTPNDLLALSERRFLVTNDHHYMEGPMVAVEDLFARKLACWTNTLDVRFDPEGEGEEGVDATVVLDSVPNNNGLAWGPGGQVVLGDALGGNVHFARLIDTDTGTDTGTDTDTRAAGDENENEKNEKRQILSVSHKIPIDGVVDNPSYFADPYAGSDGRDYSGYVLAGLGQAYSFHGAYVDPEGRAPMPSLVHFVPAANGRWPPADEKKKNTTTTTGQETRLIFSDDGSVLRGATTAVLVAIDPATTEGGRREGWLFVTGLVAPHMVATRIDFETSLGAGAGGAS
ncbi:serum paraoxonase/arylesterase family protein [Xylariaceae sp. FL0804]|nr:serum paraoxonase/arylesterase family protein [Xylariaceae sp. FL0804]